MEWDCPQHIAYGSLKEIYASVHENLISGIFLHVMCISLYIWNRAANITIGAWLIGQLMHAYNEII